MTTENKKKLAGIARLAIDGRIIEAVVQLIALARSTALWDIASAAEKLQDSYEAMLRFVAEGGNDPARNDVAASVASEILALAMRVSRALNMELGTELYFSTARSVLCHPGDSVSSSVASFRNELARLDADFESLTDPRRTETAERMLREIFNRIWVTHPLSSEDFAAIDELMAPGMPFYARAAAISAVSLGHMSYYDTRRAVWLIGRYIEYAGSQPALALRALVEAMAGMIRYRRRPVPVKLKNALASAFEVPSWPKDFASVVIEIMRAVGTDGITAKMKEGILGQLNDIEPELLEKIKKGELDIESLASELNPQWADDIEKSRLGESLREMSEIQAEGGDVFMSSFSQMKRYPFFHDIANWFIPFYDTHSAVASADSDDGMMGSFLALVPALCDSDKYSLILSLSAIPEMQKTQLLNALRQHTDQMSESLSEIEKASASAMRRNIVNKYVQNLYRFAKLFRSRNDFYNIFDLKPSPDLLQINVLKDALPDQNLYETVAQFYFRQQYWPEAVEALKHLVAVGDDGDSKERRLQQLGYAYEKNNMLRLAAETYEKAAMLGDKSEWTLRRLAAVKRLSGDFAGAAKYYSKLSSLHPDDPKLALAAAECFLDAGSTKEAEDLFHRVNYLLPNNLSALRGLAWSQFINNKIQRASDTYDIIIGMSDEPDDLERAGYVRWAQGRLDEAITLFRMYTECRPELIDALDSDIADLRDILITAGTNIADRPIIIETLRLLAKNN